MAFAIITKNSQQVFENKTLINISSQDGADIKLNLGFDFILTVQYDAVNNRCILINSANNPNFLFKGNPIGEKVGIANLCKIMVANSEEFIMIRVLPQGQTQQPQQQIMQSQPVPQKPIETVQSIQQQGFTKDDVTRLYGNGDNAETKIKIDKLKADIEQERVAIIKQVAYKINDYKNKISMGSKSSVMLHIALFFASLVCAFGVGNYLTGLPLTDAESIIQMPTNLKVVILYAVIIFGVGLMFKQGIFLYFQNKLNNDTVPANKVAESAMIFIPILFYIAIYLINILYYIAPGGFPFFAILISLFFVASAGTLAAGCGYFKSNNTENSRNLEQYEYREDFEKVTKDYQHWIEIFVNSLSNKKLKDIKEKVFELKIKSGGETLLGIVTAPFLAYAVSNTLAMCFPEAAAWQRISGLRFSPIFLTLATFMIVFGFFMFTNAFLNIRKVQGSNVLKQDGFSNYQSHGVEIYGLEGVRRLNTDKRRCFAIGLAVVFIEFSMNVSFFAQNMSDDLSGMILSIIAALVVTALLIAETYMLSQTKYDIWTLEELLSKVDKEI